MKIEDYKAVKTLLIKPDDERRYKTSEEKPWVRRVARWCRLFDKNPDQIVDVDSDEALKEQKQLVTPLIKRDLKKNGIKKRLSHFHMFLRFNGVQLTKELTDWEIDPDGRIRWILR